MNVELTCRERVMAGGSRPPKIVVVNRRRRVSQVEDVQMRLIIIIFFDLNQRYETIKTRNNKKTIKETRKQEYDPLP